MRYDGFVAGAYVSESSIADGEELINWYPEQLESPAAPNHSALYPTPGVNQLSTLGTGVSGRAQFFDAGSGRLFGVIGTSFVEIDGAGNTTVQGTVAIDSRPATISSNGPGGGQIFVTSGDNGYIFTLSTNTFTQVRTGATTQGDQLDGYFLALDAATGTMYCSNLLDGTTWDPTQFVQRSAQADPWIAMKVSPANRYIYLWGAQTAEVWYDAGTFPFPFALHPSGPIPYGIAAAFSASVCDGTVAWLGSMKSGQGAVYTASGLSATDVSTFPLRYALSQYSILSDAIGDSYNDLGHLFYLLTFPTAEVTWAFDFNNPTPSWSKRGTWISENNAYTYWRPCYHAFAFGEHRMLDLASGAIYQMSSTIGTDVDGRVIRRLRRAPGLQFELQRIYYDAFELDLETGLGNTVDPGSDPQVMLRMSNDGGKTWGNELWRSAGKIGKYQTRVIWNRCGQARRRVFEVSVTDPIPWRIMNAYLVPRQAPGRASQLQRAQWEG